MPLPSVGAWAEAKYGTEKTSVAVNNNASHGVFPTSEITESRRSYAASLAYVDEQLGRVLEALKERGELENTLILYTSDHGDMLGDQYMWRKCRPYEGSARIPMIIRWPESSGFKIKRGQTNNELVELRDVFPTFLDAAGIPKPSVMDGMSMLHILRGKKWRHQLDLEHAQIYEKDNAWVGLTDGKYKYIYFTLTGQEQLFNLNSDPGELTDLVLSGLNDKLLKSWRNKMVEHLRKRGEQWVKDRELVVQKVSVQNGINHPKFKILK
jgi:arylsulfatase A-like enzyme